MDGTTPLACPQCRGALIGGEERWSCAGCHAAFPALRGIPDLRTADDIFMPNADDWALARRLDADSDRLDFRGLLGRYFDLSPPLPPDLRRRQEAHILAADARVRAHLDALGLADDDGPVLDLGCGTGSTLAAAPGPADRLIGIDIALRWLVLARKRLDEIGKARARLVCGEAERLPIADGSLAGIVAGDVIEHVADRAATLAEAHRALRPGGRLFLATPNRFSLGPEPHVGVWGVGFLPRRWMPAYVRRRRGLDFRAVHTLGLGGWRRLLRESPFGGGTIVAPGLADDDLARGPALRRWLGRAYNAALRLPPGRAAALRVGPLFHVVCERPDPSPGPAPHPRSTPPAGRA